MYENYITQNYATSINATVSELIYADRERYRKEDQSLLLKDFGSHVDAFFRNQINAIVMQRLDESLSAKSYEKNMPDADRYREEVRAQLQVKTAHYVTLMNSHYTGWIVTTARQMAVKKQMELIDAQLSKDNETLTNLLREYSPQKANSRAYQNLIDAEYYKNIAFKNLSYFEIS